MPSPNTPSSREAETHASQAERIETHTDILYQYLTKVLQSKFSSTNLRSWQTVKGANLKHFWHKPEALFGINIHPQKGRAHSCSDRCMLHVYLLILSILIH